MSNSSTDSNKYHGGPCKNCGNTLRYKCNRQCVLCLREHAKQWQKNNRGKVNKYQREYRRADPETHREQNRIWAANNRDKVYETSRKWRLANKDKMAGYRRKWKKNNPEHKTAERYRRRANMRQVQSEHYDFKAICEHYDNRCVKCGEKKPLTVDHIQPVSKHGPNIAANIQPLCRGCNAAKGAKHIDYRSDAGPLRWVQKKLV